MVRREVRRVVGLNLGLCLVSPLLWSPLLMHLPLHTHTHTHTHVWRNMTASWKTLQRTGWCVCVCVRVCMEKLSLSSGKGIISRLSALSLHLSLLFLPLSSFFQTVSRPQFVWSLFVRAWFFYANSRRRCMCVTRAFASHASSFFPLPHLLLKKCVFGWRELCHCSFHQQPCLSEKLAIWLRTNSVAAVHATASV